MESPFTEYEWHIEDLKKENTELKERITFLGDLLFKARDLAKDVMKFYLPVLNLFIIRLKNFWNHNMTDKIIFLDIGGNL